METRGLRPAKEHGQEGAGTWSVGKKRRGGTRARKGTPTAPSQEQIKAAQKQVVNDLRGKIEIQLKDRWREQQADTGGSGTEHSGREKNQRWTHCLS
ncbi:hypothetical protein NDU88_003337 [Pleurodeles waltl]|uniref:Uncharacterized protein n=1 Tax=Pleurodeles waltl TaxID=8319 RepID=A0AAV7TQA6_PLEWA|nr:hypothetical protein NDU88_003337 [Pleurodeles waltl]